MALCKLGSNVLLVRCQKGQNKGSVSKSRARITSCSSGPADAGRLTPALGIDMKHLFLSIFLLYVAGCTSNLYVDNDSKDYENVGIAVRDVYVRRLST